jgi:hypothetical protein
MMVVLMVWLTLLSILSVTGACDGGAIDCVG